jgi:hypothetical protein
MEEQEKVLIEGSNITFKKVSDQFGKFDIANVVSCKYGIIISDKERRFCVVIEPNGTWSISIKKEV